MKFELQQAQGSLKRQSYHIQQWRLTPEEGFSFSSRAFGSLLVKWTLLGEAEDFFQDNSGLALLSRPQVSLGMYASPKPRAELIAKVLVENLRAPEETYNPFKHYYHKEGAQSLYLQLANLNPDSEKDILGFVNQYGLLNLKSPFSLWPLREDPRLRQLIEAWPQLIHAELVSDFQAEWLYLRLLLDLWRALQAQKESSYKSPEGLKHPKSENLFAREEGSDEALENLREAYHEFWGWIEFFSSGEGTVPSYQKREGLLGGQPWKPKAEVWPSPETLPSRAEEFFTEMLNLKLGAISPYLSSVKGKPELGYQTSTLSGALYTMFFYDVIEGKRIRQCQNQRCRKLFTTTNRVKIYCSTNCAQAQTSRDRFYRRKEKEGKPVTPRASKKGEREWLEGV